MPYCCIDCKKLTIYKKQYNCNDDLIEDQSSVFVEFDEIESCNEFEPF